VSCFRGDNGCIQQNNYSIVVLSLDVNLLNMLLFFASSAIAILLRYFFIQFFFLFVLRVTCYIIVFLLKILLLYSIFDRGYNLNILISHKFTKYISLLNLSISLFSWFLFRDSKTQYCCQYVQYASTILSYAGQGECRTGQSAGSMAVTDWPILRSPCPA